MQIFDSHLHIIDPRFPLVANNGFTPDHFTVTDYARRLALYDVVGGVVVSGSFQSTDTSYLLAALQELGPKYIGVINLDLALSNRQIIDLAKNGVAGIRFNLVRNTPLPIDYLREIAVRVYELVGWHTELYADISTSDIAYDLIPTLPKVAIDHLGLCSLGTDRLLDVVSEGCKVKATGFGRISSATDKILQQVNEADSSALMFGTDLPSTRADRPFHDADVATLKRLFRPESCQQIFVDNARLFYGL